MDNEFVKECRLANEVEKDACAKALLEFGKEPGDYADIYLYGRYDAPYGWYVFGLNSCRDAKGEYLILGDCLDVLPDYGRVLSLKEVHDFAICEMDGRYEALQDWGLFQPVSPGMKNAICDVAGDEALDERMEWSDDAREWQMAYDVHCRTADGKDLTETVSFTAFYDAQGTADRRFSNEWQERILDCYRKCAAGAPSGNGDWEGCKAKTDAMRTIALAMAFYINTGRTDYAEFKAAENGKSGTSVYVLTIMADGRVRPEAHRTFDGALDAAMADIREHCGYGEGVLKEIWTALGKNLHWDWVGADTGNAVTYDITECRVAE